MFDFKTITTLQTEWRQKKKANRKVLDSYFKKFQKNKSKNTLRIVFVFLQLKQLLLSDKNPAMKGIDFKIVKQHCGKKFIQVAFCLSFCYTAIAQNSVQHNSEHRKIAENTLELALSKKAEHNIINPHAQLIKDTITALTIAETILFSIFDKTSILNQKPYEIHHITNYWVIFGTLPKEYIGGTFLLILDDRNAEVLTITHGK